MEEDQKDPDKKIAALIEFADSKGLGLYESEGVFFAGICVETTVAFGKTKEVLEYPSFYQERLFLNLRIELEKKMIAALQASLKKLEAEAFEDDIKH